MMDWRDAYWLTAAAAPVLPPAGSAPSVLQPAGGAVQVLCPPAWYSSSSVQPVQLLAPATSLASSLDSDGDDDDRSDLDGWLVDDDVF